MARGDFAVRLARNALGWVVAAAVAWLMLAPLYNRFLAGGAERLLHVLESPNASRLYVRDGQILRVTRLDVGGGQSALHELRLADFHFNWILLATLFLATPGAPAGERLRTLGWSALALAAFHLLLVVFAVESLYANGLGAWSAAHSGAWGRNFWGLGKHLLDLPVKFALPFALWAFFHLPRLRAASPASAAQRKRKSSAASSS